MGTIEGDLADVFIENKHMIVKEYYDSNNFYERCLEVIKKRLDQVKELMCKPM